MYSGRKYQGCVSKFDIMPIPIGDFAAGTAGNMLNRAISGEKQNLGEPVGRRTECSRERSIWKEIHRRSEGCL